MLCVTAPASDLPPLVIDRSRFSLIGPFVSITEYLFVKATEHTELLRAFLKLFSFCFRSTRNNAESPTKTTHHEKQSTGPTSEEISRTTIDAGARDRGKQSEVHRSGRSTCRSVEIEENGRIPEGRETTAKLESARRLGRQCRGRYFLERRPTDGNLFVREMLRRIRSNIFACL